MSTESKGLKLSDILITVFIAVIFAIIYKVWWGFYGIAEATGLRIEQLTYGMWFIAAIIAYLLIKKPGVALLAEFAAGAGETIVMGQFHIPTLIYAFLQGLACELVFMLYRYNKHTLFVSMLAGVAAAIASFPIDWYYGYLSEVQLWNVILMLVFRIISGAILAGGLAYVIVKALEKTGVTKLLRPSQKEDYDAL